MAAIATIDEGQINPNQPVRELDVLWITAGLGCDGESIAMTAATQPRVKARRSTPCETLHRRR